MLLLLSKASAAVSFVSIGDWGGAALEESDYKQNTYAVAKQFATTAKLVAARFVIQLGDSFYWCGLENATDYQINADWVQPYLSHDSLRVNWYGALGNHEYGYNVSAVMSIHDRYPNWVLPSRYYTERVLISGSTYLTMIFLDSSPCVSAYRSSSNAEWDPCGSEYPTCSISGGSDPFEGPCKFHQNILTQNCDDQLAWFKTTLAQVDKDDWLVVSAHHPLEEMDELDFIAPLQARGFDLFLNGHAHTMSQYTVDGAGAYVTSGAGAMVSTTDNKIEHGYAPLGSAQNRTFYKELGANLKASPLSNGHSYETVFNKKIAAFTVHTFSDDLTTLTTDFITFTGENIHSFTTKKGGSPAPGPPSPFPSPSPPSPSPTPSGGGCCHYSDVSCRTGDVCCKTKCDEPATCSYTQSGCSGQYGKAHHCKWTGSQCVVDN